MRSSTILSVAIISFIFSCSSEKKETADTFEMISSEPTYRLEKQWESDTLLRTPESVLYDSERDVIYVSNVNMNPWEKDGNGFMSKVSPTGEILELEWVTGLNGPKGMALVESSLFVTDMDELIEIDVNSGEILSKQALEGAKGLNDISADAEGTLYISDSNGNKLYKYSDGGAEVFKDTPGRPNGQLVVGSYLYTAFSRANQFGNIDLETGEMTVLADSIGAGDGITPTPEAGVFLVSDWSGEIWIIGDFGKQSLLVTRDQKKNTADICFIEDQELVIVPTFFDNRVVAYKLIKS